MKWRVAGLLIFLILLLGGTALAVPVGNQNDQVRAVADPLVDNLLTGFNQGDYAQYSRDFDDTLREAIPEKKFQQVRADILKKLGKFKEKKYLGFLNQQAHTMVLWKGAFSGTSDDVLIKLVLSRRQGKVQVVGLWFQ
jgi:hypothetical protein